MSKLTRFATSKWLGAEAWIARQVKKVDNNRGQGAIEYLALAAVLVGVLAFVLSQKEGIGGAIVGKIMEAISSISFG